jgi:hypothetical protein
MVPVILFLRSYALTISEKTGAAIDYAARYGTGLAHIISKITNPIKVA